MTQIEKANLLLTFYKTNGFTWSSSVVLEPLGRVMYELGKADSRFEDSFKSLEDLRETPPTTSEKPFPSAEIVTWLNLEIDEFNPVLRMAVYSLWLGLEMMDAKSDYEAALISSLKRKHFRTLKLFLPSVAKMSDLADLIDQFEATLDISKTEAERFCTRYIELFLNSFFKTVSTLNKKIPRISANQISSRQLQCLTLFELNDELSLHLLIKGISNSEYQRMFNCNRMAAKRDLQSLTKIKLLRLKDEARGRSTKYVLN